MNRFEIWKYTPDMGVTETLPGFFTLGYIADETASQLNRILPDFYWTVRCLGDLEPED